MTAQNNWWADLPTYEGADLGLTYTPQYVDVKIWSPIAQEVTLRFYKKDTPTADNADLIETVKMTKGDKGVWSHRAEGNRTGQFYTVQVTTLEGKIMKEAVICSGVIPQITCALGFCIGAAAFVAQKILKDPLNKIISSEYIITGTWDKPVEIESEKDGAQKPSSKSPLSP